jgi:hypothetical protein
VPEFLEKYWTLLLAVAGGLVVGGLLLAVLLRWRRGRRPLLEPWQPTVVDVRGMPSHGPPPDGPQLTCYGEPIRLALLVIAPIGRDRNLPSNDAMPGIVEAIVPGLMPIIVRDQPQFHRWPAQLSVHGFCQAFSSCFPLPGNRGKGTPWCSIAGRGEHQEGGYLLGLVGCGSRPIHLGHVEITSAGKWFDVLRLRSG